MAENMPFWRSYEGIPPMAHEFQKSRHPLIAKQVEDLIKTETQRREEQSGRQSNSTEKTKPQLKPTFQKQKGGVSPQQKQGWLKEQRDQALSQAKQAQSQQGRTQERSPDNQPKRQRER
jgi:hypothetical protein